MTQDAALEALLAPIPGDQPGGEDLSYGSEFDAIRDARRADDPNLAQGEWETEVKTANWPKVRELCESLLKNRSKDLQLACWYTEAMAQINGFCGLHWGLRVLNSMVTDFWEFCHPALEAGDLDERAGKIEWLSVQLPLVVRSIPMTSRESGGYSWLRWEESREVANLGLKDGDGMAKAIAEGRLSGEAFDKAVAASGRAYYEKLNAEIADAVASLAELESGVDRAFGHDAPGLKDLRDSLRACADLSERLLKSLGGGVSVPTDAMTAVDEVASSAEVGNLPASSTEGGYGGEPPAFLMPPEASPSQTSRVSAGPVQSRAEAIRQLRLVAEFFRRTEPHSPVAPLVERAAKWAEMPLEQWLAHVIKDDSTLGRLRDLLDFAETE
jgi:type VI secretion system protein ImpA